MEQTNFKPIFGYIDEKLSDLGTDLRSELASKADIKKVISNINAHILRAEL